MAAINLPRTIRATQTAFANKSLKVSEMIDRSFKAIKDNEHLNAFVTV